MLLCMDFDGVIADSLDYLLDVAENVQAEMGIGRAPTRADFREIETLTFKAFAERLGFGPERADEFSERVLAHQKARVDYPPVFPSIAEALPWLAQVHDIVIVTASHADYVSATLAPYDLLACVQSTMGAELGLAKSKRIDRARSEAMERGPAPDAPELSRVDQPSRPNRPYTYFVGDTTSDIRAGKEAGVDTIAVSWGFHSQERLARERPTHLISTVAELVALVGV